MNNCIGQTFVVDLIKQKKNGMQRNTMRVVHFNISLRSQFVTRMFVCSRLSKLVYLFGARALRRIRGRCGVLGYNIHGEEIHALENELCSHAFHFVRLQRLEGGGREANLAEERAEVCVE